MDTVDKSTVTIEIPADTITQTSPVNPITTPIVKYNPSTTTIATPTVPLGNHPIPEQLSQPESNQNNAGRPCEFCSNKDEILKRTREYIESGKTDKPRMLFLNELAIKLNKHRETIMNWANKKLDNGEREHPEFFDMIKSVEEIQELRLQQRVLGRYNPTGAIFLLKTKHGYIETEKKLLGGDKNTDPIDVRIIEEKEIPSE